jgi:four helix bundle protein
MTILDHEKLDIYQHTLTFVATAHEIATALPGKRGDLGDQLRRASTSIALNIAEGAGEFAPNEKARFYRMARRSAVECAAVLDIAERLGLRSSGSTKTHADLVRIVGGIVRLIHSCERRSEGPGAGAGAAATGTDMGMGRGTGHRAQGTGSPRDAD